MKLWHFRVWRHSVEFLCLGQNFYNATLDCDPGDSVDWSAGGNARVRTLHPSMLVLGQEKASPNFGGWLSYSEGGYVRSFLSGHRDYLIL